MVVAFFRASAMEVLLLERGLGATRERGLPSGGELDVYRSRNSGGMGARRGPSCCERRPQTGSILASRTITPPPTWPANSGRVLRGQRSAAMARATLSARRDGGGAAGWATAGRLQRAGFVARSRHMSRSWAVPLARSTGGEQGATRIGERSDPWVAPRSTPRMTAASSWNSRTMARPPCDSPSPTSTTREGLLFVLLRLQQAEALVCSP